MLAEEEESQMPCILFVVFYFIFSSLFFGMLANVSVGTPSIDGVLMLIYSYMFLSSHLVSLCCL